MKSPSWLRLTYIISDYITTNIGWLAFSCLRYNWYLADITAQGFNSMSSFLLAKNVVLGQIIVPLAALIIYYMSGYYVEVYRKSRVQEFFATALSSLAITLGIFFAILINDLHPDRIDNYEIFAAAWASIFAPLYVGRYAITTYVERQLKRQKWAFNTLIIGNGKKAHRFVTDYIDSGKLRGYRLIDFFPIPSEENAGNANPQFIDLQKLQTTCFLNNITEIIVVPTSLNREELLTLINSILYLGANIKLPPEYISYVTGSMKLSPFINEPLISMGQFSMNDFNMTVKRVIDILGGAIGAILSSPILLAAAIMIKRDSDGPVIYTQTRIGYRNRPFKIYKLRTMYNDAEGDGVPRLSSENDKRITRVGATLRKYRIDEIPQFFNVIKGDMSLVGPRPERQYFIDMMMEKSPDYALLHSIRPGMTSYGMVKYGYASDLDGMLLRMQYDITYIRNMSLLTDFQILLSTVSTVIRGHGL